MFLLRRTELYLRVYAFLDKKAEILKRPTFRFYIIAESIIYIHTL